MESLQKLLTSAPVLPDFHDTGSQICHPNKKNVTKIFVCKIRRQEPCYRDPVALALSKSKRLFRITPIQLCLLNRQIAWHCHLFVVFLDSRFPWCRKYISTGWIIFNSGLSDGWSGCSYWFIHHHFWLTFEWLMNLNSSWKYTKRIYVPNKITTTKWRQKL